MPTYLPTTNMPTTTDLSDISTPDLSTTYILRTIDSNELPMDAITGL
jgi:hypothetical protein